MKSSTVITVCAYYLVIYGDFVLRKKSSGLTQSSLLLLSGDLRAALGGDRTLDSNSLNSWQDSVLHLSLPLLSLTFLGLVVFRCACQVAAYQMSNA